MYYPLVFPASEDGWLFIRSSTCRICHKRFRWLTEVMMGELRIVFQFNFISATMVYYLQDLIRNWSAGIYEHTLLWFTFISPDLEKKHLWIFFMLFPLREASNTSTTSKSYASWRSSICNSSNISGWNTVKIPNRKW